jgi:hypothetical protein
VSAAARVLHPTGPALLSSGKPFLEKISATALTFLSTLLILYYDN